MSVLTQILEHKIVAIIRGANPPDVIRLANALHAGGIRAIEITMNSEGALDLIEQLSDTMKDKMLVGAGTVLDPRTAKRVIKAGAQFIISPCFDKKLIHTTLDKGAVSIPGAYTPTEIVTAYKWGGEIIKVFPSSPGFNYIREVRAPLPHIPLMPTGGIKLENIGEFQKAGAVAFGIGTALVNTRETVTENYLQELRERARKFVEAIKV